MPRDVLLRDLAEHGFCHVRCDTITAAEACLLSAQDALGPIVRHDRSREDGLVPVVFKPEIDEEARLISDTSGEAEAHMDGVFMPTPPGVIALGVVELSAGAPETYSIDFGSILARLSSNEILRHARHDAAQITRADRTEAFTPLRFAKSRVDVRYRFDDGVGIQALDGGEPLFQQMHRLIKKSGHKSHGLAEGSVIFFDNRRMLHGRDSFDPGATSRLLLRAWYPADKLELGVPWKGADAEGDPTPADLTQYCGRTIKVQDGSVHLYGDGHAELVFAIKQVIGYRHSPLAWSETEADGGLRLTPTPRQTDEAIGRWLAHDLSIFLKGLDAR